MQLQQKQQIAVPVKSKDSEGSLPSVMSTGSNQVLSPHINQKGDELLKAAAVAQQQQQQVVNNKTTTQQQYAAALAAIAQQAPVQANLALLQNPAQLAAAMAQATVAVAQQSLTSTATPEQQQQQTVQAQQPIQNVAVQQPVQQNGNASQTRPASVGSQPSGCHTSDGASSSS